MTMQTAKAGAALAALVAMTSGGAVGEDRSAVRRATLELRAFATWSGGETHPIGSLAIAPLEEGGSTTATLRVGVSPVADGSLPCRSNVGMDAAGTAQTAEGPLPLWQVEAELRRAEMDDVRVKYAWTRRTKAGVGSSPEASDRGEAHLSEGGRVLLDFVPAFEASSGCWRNVALELSASIPEEPTFKDRRLGYDLWLVSEGRGGRLKRRLQLIGKQGEKVAFDFGAFRSKLPVSPQPHSESEVMEMTMTGSIRGRIQADGSIEMLLAAVRGARPGDGHWATGAFGSKKVLATPGETLRLELPPPSPPPGVDEPHTSSALAEQRVALVLTPSLVD